MKHTKGKEMCPCGFPQSYPIPHEHDQTEREKVIIKHFRDAHKELLEACRFFMLIYGNTGYSVPTENSKLAYNKAQKAIAKAEGK